MKKCSQFFNWLIFSKDKNYWSEDDHLCCYSISVQYWNDGKMNFESTGAKNHVFGIAKSQLSPAFEIEIPFSDEANESVDGNEKINNNKRPEELNVMYSFNFPVDELF